MTELIKKYFSVDKIKKIAKNKNYDEISLDEYIRFLDLTIKEEETCKINRSSILRYADEYMSLFVWERKKGFSVEWSKGYAKWCLMEGPEHACAIAYKEVKDVNPEKALEELNCYAGLTNKDEFFVKHFAFLIEVDVPSTIPSVEDQAEEYSKIYKQQIAKGKSELFAHCYADDKATEKHSEEWCYNDAVKYENDNKSMAGNF